MEKSLLLFTQLLMCYQKSKEKTALQRSSSLIEATYFLKPNSTINLR